MKDEGPRLFRRSRALLGSLVLLSACLVLWALAYQAPLRQTVSVGGELETRRRFDDAPFLSGVNGPEPGDQVDDPASPGERLWWWELLERTGGRPYRWTKAEASFLIPGAGGGRYSVELLAGGRPGGAPTVWEAGPGLRYELSLPEGPPRRYRLLAATDGAGDLRLRMLTTPYTAAGDPRELGFVLHAIRVAPADGAPRAPAWPQLGWLAIAVAGVYAAGLAAGAGPWGASGLSAAGVLWAGYVLALHRPALTVFTPTLALLAVVCAAASYGGLLAARGLGRRSATLAGLAPVVALVAAAFAVRAAGMLHPHALYSDSGLQANKLFEATLGRVFLSAGLPSEAGGGQAPYPPGPFLVLMPLQLLFPEGRGARVLLMQTGTALLDSLAVAAIWLILRRAGAGQRAALLGAACYLLPTAALESFSVGELANLGGQALALPFIALLAIGALRKRPPLGGALGRRGRADGELGRRGQAHAAFILHPSSFILCIALLGHSGVTLSVGALVAAAWALALAGALRGRGGAIGLGRLTMVAGAALAAAVLLFYSAPVYLEGLVGRGGEVAGAGAGARPAEVVAATARAVVGLAPPAGRGLAIPSLLGTAALAGLALLWAQSGGRGQASEIGPAGPGAAPPRSTSTAYGGAGADSAWQAAPLRATPEAHGGAGADSAWRAAPLRATLAAWWLGMLLTQGLLLVADQGVRWAMFLYPGLCLSAGPLLAALWRRGRAGRLVAALAVGAIIVYGLWAWVAQVRDYYHR